MTTQYTRIRTSVEVSDHSTYDQADVHSTMEEHSGAEAMCGLHFTATPTGQTIDLTYLDACENLIIENLSDTITIRVKYRSVLGSTTVANGVFANANPDTFTKVGSTFTLNGAVDGCIGIFTGTDEAGNTGTFQLQQVTDTVITAASSVSWTADADDTSCTVEFVQVQCQKISPGQAIKISNWDPRATLIFIAGSDSPSVRITAW